MKNHHSCTFSIGVPAFKGRFLQECIESILAQTFRDFELIIINDCSPEALDEIIGRYDDRRISYYKNPTNVGAEHVIQNWNKCLAKASGEFFILMGDDDMMEPDYLKEFLKVIHKYPTLDVYHCRSQIIDENSDTVTLTPSWPEFETIYDNIWHRINNGKRVQFISDFVFRTSFLREKGGFYDLPLAWGSDEITSYIACGIKGIAHTNKPVFKYRRSRINITSTGSPESKMKAIGLEQKWLNEFLLTPPSCSVNFILYKDINRIVDKHIQRKRIQVISASLKKSFWRNSGKWIYHSGKYNTSVTEVFYAMMIRIYHDLRINNRKEQNLQNNEV